MKRQIILAAFIMLLSFVGVSNAQSLRLTFDEAILTSLEPNAPLSTIGNWGEGKRVKIDFVKTSKDTTETLINYSGLENPGGQLFEAVLPAASEEACLASRDFSSAMPVGPERATLKYDPTTDTGILRWSLARNDSASCRVLLVRNSTDSGDYAVWRTNFGLTGSRPFEEAGTWNSDESKDGAPQRSRVTSVTVTFNTVVTLP